MEASVPGSSEALWGAMNFLPAEWSRRDGRAGEMEQERYCEGPRNEFHA